MDNASELIVTREKWAQGDIQEANCPILRDN